MLDERPDDELTLDDLTKLVVSSGLVNSELLDGLRDKALARYVGGILRTAHLESTDGSQVRAFQNYTKFRQTEDGKEVQLQIWKDIDAMSREQMLIAAKQRAKHIKDSRESLAADIRCWNNNVRPKMGGAQIRLEF